MMGHHGTVDWWIALTAVTAWRMVAVDSASSPTAKPKQSTRCTTGRWKVCAISTNRVILRDAAAPQAPPPYSGSPARIATGQPSSRANPVMMALPKAFDSSMKLPWSTSESMIFRIE